MGDWREWEGHISGCLEGARCGSEWERYIYGYLEGVSGRGISSGVWRGR